MGFFFAEVIFGVHGLVVFIVVVCGGVAVSAVVFSVVASGRLSCSHLLYGCLWLSWQRRKNVRSCKILCKIADLQISKF